MESDRLNNVKWALLGLALWVGWAQAAPPQIIGGSAVTQAHPWMVAVLDNRLAGSARGGQVCGGTLIAPQWVLTAAHCFDRYPKAEDVSVAVGVTTLSSQMPRQAVAAVFIHPNYDELTIRNDLALLKLAQPSSAPPLPLAAQSDLAPLQSGDLLTVMGWGATTNIQPAEYASSLLQADLPFVDSYSCQAYYPSEYDATRQLCAGGLVAGQADACWGDSGGPLILGYPSSPALAGIVSFGQGCADQPPGVYTRPAAYLDWVNSYLQGSYGVQLTQGAVDFGYRGVGESSQQMVALVNHSQQTLTLSSVSLVTQSGGATALIDDSGCGTLAAGARCQLGVALQVPYAPNAEQWVQIQLSLRFSNGETLTFPLSAQVLMYNSTFGTTLGLTEMVYTGSDSQRSGASWQRDWDQTLGGYVLYSGALSPSEASMLMASFVGTGYLSFDWKVSSEPLYDGIEVQVNGERLGSISGESGWLRKTITLRHAENRVVWMYGKDDNISEGWDRAWLKNVEWKPGPVAAEEKSGGSSLDWLLVMLFLVPAAARIHRRQEPHRTR